MQAIARLAETRLAGASGGRAPEDDDASLPVAGAPPHRPHPDADSRLLQHLRQSARLPAPVLQAAQRDLLRGAGDLRGLVLASGALDEDGLLAEMAAAWGGEVHRGALAADAGLVDRIGIDRCLRLNLTPVGRAGGAVLLATGRPAEVMRHAEALSERIGGFRLVLASAARVEAALLASRRIRIADRAEECIAADESCRRWRGSRLRRLALPFTLAALAAAVAWPRAMLAALTLWAVLMLLGTTVLKVVATVIALRRLRMEAQVFRSRRALPPSPRPLISILVPLFHEPEIAGRLIERLSRLTYPKDRLEICLVMEQDDAMTQAAVARASLPHWMRAIEVPMGHVKTKPRALNFALGLCRGEIVGIYDAEDAPASDQLDIVAEGFARAAPEVVCLQGALDYYNPHQNWLSRAFTIEYATWFRLMLPGLARTGLVVPLGGTTLFFRRDALEAIGGWDAWNVTEDADLGVRLARHGWRTELIPTATGEEANCRAWPWIRQRSRWLKGYAMTWATHMRHPVGLWRDLGARRFFGLQLLFLGTLSQFLLAPLLWSFWALPFGFGHPLLPVAGPAGLTVAGAVFFASEAVNIAAALIALRATRHRGLAPWVLTMMFYFPLATVAGWKAMFEIVSRPFYWDKTAHGLMPAPAVQPPSSRRASARSRVS